MMSLNSEDKLVRELLNGIAVREKFNDYSVVIDQALDKQKGYVGIMRRAKINGTKNNKLTELSLIVKTDPENEKVQKLLNTKCVFEREIFAYERFLTELSRFQVERGLTLQMGFFAYPKFYGSINDAESHLYGFILEDLSAGGYEIFNLYESENIEHIAITIKELAKFHAISLAMYDQKPEKFEEFLNLKDIHTDTVNLDIHKHIRDNAFNHLIAMYDAVNDAEIINKITELRDDFVNLTLSFSSRKFAEPYAVIAHMDVSCNNIMFKGSPENNEVKVSIFDWARIQACSPAYDILFFLFVGTTKKIRDQYFNDLIDNYYSTLKETIIACGSNPTDLKITRENLQMELNKYGKYVALMASMHLPWILASVYGKKHENILDALEQFFHNYADGLVRSDKIELFNKLIKDIFEDLISLGYL